MNQQHYCIIRYGKWQDRERIWDQTAVAPAGSRGTASHRGSRAEAPHTMRAAGSVNNDEIICIVL